VTEQNFHEDGLDFIFSGSFPEDQEIVPTSQFGYWPEVPECEGELSDIEIPFTDELSEEESTPLNDPFLFLYEEDDSSDPDNFRPENQPANTDDGISFLELTEQAADYVTKHIKGRMLREGMILLEIITKAERDLPNELTGMLPKAAGIITLKFFTVFRFYLFKPLTEYEEQVLYSYFETEEIIAYESSQSNK
jgi:hypothetical protein